MKVYVVSEGTCNEGGEPIKVFSTKEKAFKYANVHDKNEITNFTGEMFIPDKNIENYVQINEMEVE